MKYLNAKLAANLLDPFSQRKVCGKQSGSLGITLQGSRRASKNSVFLHNHLPRMWHPWKYLKAFVAISILGPLLRSHVFHESPPVRQGEEWKDCGKRWIWVRRLPLLLTSSVAAEFQRLRCSPSFPFWPGGSPHCPHRFAVRIMCVKCLARYLARSRTQGSLFSVCPAQYSFFQGLKEYKN